MSDYSNRVDANLKGLEFVSTGVCSGCTDCAQGVGFERLTDEWDDPVETEAQWLERFDEEVSSGGFESRADEFSKSSCGICDTPYHGARYYWHGVNPETNEILHFDDACPDCVTFLAYGTEPGEES